MYVSQATLTKEEMFKVCHFMHHILLMSTQQFITRSRKVALFHKAFYSFFFSFRLKLMWWWVSVCQSSSMYPVEARDSCSLKRNKSHICTFSSPLWPFPTATYAVISIPVSLTDLCVLLFVITNKYTCFLLQFQKSIPIFLPEKNWLVSLGFINVTVPLNFSLLFNADILLSFIWLGWYSRANLISAPKHYDSGQ